jgi:hypothetical protein
MQQWEGLTPGDSREVSEGDQTIIYYVSDGEQRNIILQSPYPSRVLSIEIDGKPNMGSYNAENGFVGFAVKPPATAPPAGAKIKIIAE